MIFPFEALSGFQKEIGYVVAVLIGIGFGFVLERAGFGRSTKLAAQFYFYDMTVFKVMFTAIVTAMLGVIVADGLGLTDISLLARSVVSETFVGPMIFGGLLLGAGFIISGYCPGTSLVSSASGNADGILTFVGVVIGSVLFGAIHPLVAGFYTSGNLGQVFLYEWLHIPPAVMAMGVAVMAVVCFIGGEIVERIAVKKLFDQEASAGRPQPRRTAIAVFAIASAAGLALMFIPVGQGQAQGGAAAANVQTIEVQAFAKRVLDEPWKLRIIDLRPNEDYLEKRIPGSESATLESLGDLGLQYSRGIRDLVLVGGSDADLTEPPPAVLAYPGNVYLLDGGFAAWNTFALTAPAAPAEGASEQELASYRFQSGVHSAMTGVKAPPPPPSTTKFVAPPKRKAGGCS